MEYLRVKGSEVVERAWRLAGGPTTDLETKHTILIAVDYEFGKDDKRTISYVDHEVRPSLRVLVRLEDDGFDAAREAILHHIDAQVAANMGTVEPARDGKRIPAHPHELRILENEEATHAPARMKFFTELFQTMRSDRYRDEKYPRWFRMTASAQRAAPPTTETNSLVARSLDQMYEARAAFKDDAKNAITVMIALITAASILLFKTIPPAESASSDTPNSDPGYEGIPLIVVSLGTIAAFLATAYASQVYLKKIYAGYRLYVAAVINSAMLTWRSGLPFTHAWHIELHRRFEQYGQFLKHPGESAECRFIQANPSEPLKMCMRKWQPRTGADQDPNSPRFATEVEELIVVWMSEKDNLWQLHKRSLDYVCRVCVALALVSLVLYFCNKQTSLAWGLGSGLSFGLVLGYLAAPPPRLLPLWDGWRGNERRSPSPSA